MTVIDGCVILINVINDMKKCMWNIKRGITALALGVLVFAPQMSSAQIVDIATLKDETGLPLNDFINILTGIMKWALAIVSVLAVLGFAIAGILYLTAAGDEDQIARARRAFTGSVIGIIVALLGLIVLQAAQTVLSGEDVRF